MMRIMRMMRVMIASRPLTTDTAGHMQHVDVADRRNSESQLREMKFCDLTGNFLQRAGHFKLRWTDATGNSCLCRAQVTRLKCDILFPYHTHKLSRALFIDFCLVETCWNPLRELRAGQMTICVFGIESENSSLQTSPSWSKLNSPKTLLALRS